MKFSVPEAPDAPKKGIAENTFYDFLKKNFPESTIFHSMKYYPKFPDICLLEKSTGVYVDIDEPYALADRKPIHCEGYDYERDNYFCGEGFLVIRFTEDQVVNYPMDCYNVITKSLTHLADVGSDIDLIYHSQEYKKIKQKKWTFDEALTMSKNHTRKDSIDKLNIFNPNHPLNGILTPRSDIKLDDLDLNELI